ncbi:hypothetical protein [Escherichia coli]|uniref:hypothetical protein n=3 Tax=Enterobacterales TaxID=91347 RepID=UPI000BA9C515|nr:hypothetical protein [Escherichia coli]
MRLFNPVTLTEVIPGLHDVTGAVELPEDNWFFTASEIPEGMEISVNEKGEPILIEIKPSQVELARYSRPTTLSVTVVWSLTPDTPT